MVKTEPGSVLNPTQLSADTPVFAVVPEEVVNRCDPPILSAEFSPQLAVHKDTCGSSPSSYTEIENNDDVDVEDDEFPVPPDGGYGWVIVVASFFANMIADGFGFSFGVLFAEFIEVFDASRAKTAWIGSIFVAMPSICGPIASALTDRFGCRPIMIAGSVIAAIGCFASAFVNSIGLLCLTFGIVAGFGLALVFLPAMLIVAFYFKEKRAFATG